jgi:hypothetical protein
MRGYLQRMAASVLSRERAIHPVVGSLWAPQSGAAPIEQSGEMLVPGSRSVHDAEADRGQNLPRTVLHPEQDSAESTRVASEPAAHTDASHSNAGAEMKLLLPMANALASEQIHSLPIENESGQPQSQRSTFTPLVPEFVQRPAAQNLAMQAPAPLHSAAQRSHPVAQPAHEPDTIEIHIGRIEVLAAQPQPAQRPPARPAHKPLDLREYLGRGGRTR